jgi:uncharacterized protein
MSDVEFELSSAEGLPIRGNLHLPQKMRAVVVVVHGFKGFKDWGFFPWMAERLSQQRLAVCRFNMSRSGIGNDPETFDRLDLFADDTYSRQLDDLAVVIRHVEAQLPAMPIVLMGHSRGGAIAILGARGVPQLKGVVAWSPIARCDRWDEPTRKLWRERGALEVVNQRTGQLMRNSTAVLDDVEQNRERLDVLAAAARLTVPLLVVHGGRDDSVPFAEGKALAERAADGSFARIDRAGHTFNAIHPLIHVPFELVMATELTAHFATART